MTDKVVINVKKGEATITGGKDSFVGKLLAAKGKLNINVHGLKQEVKIK